MPAFGRVLARLFVLQASWNYERMQGVGFGYAAEPALRALEGGPQGARYRAALAREAHFFNAHPYFASLAVGAAVRAEMDGEPPERIERLRETLCGPLGSIGDRLFWASWLPATSALGLALVALGARWWAAVAFLVLYNVVHVACRVWGLRAGWDHGLKVVLALQSPALRAASRVAAPLASVVVGAALPIAFAWQLRGASERTWLVAAVGAALFAIVLRLLGPRASGVALAGALLALTWVAGLLWS